MLFGSKSIVGIEINSSQIRFVWLDSSAEPAKVLDFGVADLFSAHPENIAQQLMAVVQKRGLENQKASLAVSGPAIVHHTFTIPPMSKKDMRIVVEREVKKVIASPLDEMVFDWKVSRDVEVAEGKKREVLVIIAPLSLISSQISLLKQSGLKPFVLTTIPLILLNSLNFTEERDKATAFIHLGKDEGNILFARKGIYYFSRNFSLEAKDEDSKGLQEVQRSILYFNQSFPGERLEMVILSGDAEDLSLTWPIQLDNWRERLGVEFKVFDPVHNLDLAPLGGRAKEFCEIATQLAIPLGLAHGLSKALPINLSVHIKGKRSQLNEKRLAIIIAAVFLLFTVGGYVGLLLRTNHYSQILREKKAALQELQPLLREIEVFQKQRDIYQRRSAFLQRLSGRNALLVRVLQNLSLLVPEEVVFQSLKIERAEKKWQATIKGEATASDQVIALSAYNRLRSGLKASSSFTNVEFLPPKMGSIKQTTGISSPGSGEGKTMIGFEIKCEIRE
ncbi:MAG: pilus assembly protein PilM [Candidatus Latescibacter sp.]|nr:pilus assembly protein PilM [Candidatus Latescibacter sp.]